MIGGDKFIPECVDSFTHFSLIQFIGVQALQRWANVEISVNTRTRKHTRSPPLHKKKT
jgi:hypothetical protein